MYQIFLRELASLMPALLHPNETPFTANNEDIMKKYQSCALLVSALTLSSTAAFAFTPIITGMMFFCPCVDTITKNGESVQGIGRELFFGETEDEVTFQSSTVPSTLPDNFSRYTVTDIDYNSTQGQLTCKYNSSNASQEPFSLNYTIINGIGGSVLAQTNSAILIGMPIGLK